MHPFISRGISQVCLRPATHSHTRAIDMTAVSMLASASESKDTAEVAGVKGRGCMQRSECCILAALRLSPSPTVRSPVRPHLVLPPRGERGAADRLAMTRHFQKTTHFARASIRSRREPRRRRHVRTGRPNGLHCCRPPHQKLSERLKGTLSVV